MSTEQRSTNRIADAMRAINKLMYRPYIEVCVRTSPATAGLKFAYGRASDTVPKKSTQVAAVL